MNKNKNIIINMLASIVALGINLIINFLFTPYIVNRVGSEAYGFVGLANNIINYITIITVALNSTAGRFISIRIYRNDIDKANKYFNSVLISNIILSIFVLVITIFVVWKLEYLINIPIELVTSVRTLFIYMSINFILSLVGTVFTVGTFISNKLYLSSIVNIGLAILKFILLTVLFVTKGPNIAYYGSVACICSIVGLICNIGFTNKLVKQLKIRYKYFDWNSIVEIITSGIWNSITKVSQVLSDGLDLLISNIWISSLAMGQLSIAKIISTTLANLLGTVTSIFVPDLTRYYANKQIDTIVEELKKNMRITGFFANIPLCFIIVFGDIFFSVWMPTQDNKMIHLLAILSIQGAMVSGATTALNNVFLLTNKLKINSLVWFSISIFNITIVMILINFTKLGIYAVAGVSTTFALLANLIFLPIYSAKCLGVKWNTFYNVILRYIFTNCVILACLIIIKFIFFKVSSWSALIISIIITVLISGLINFMFLITKVEREGIVKIFRVKLLKLKK